MTPGLGTALSATKWTRLEIVIHGDSDLMPKNKRMWAGELICLFSLSCSRNSL